MAFITVQFDKGQLSRVQDMLKGIPRSLPVVMSRGINRTLATTRAETVRQMKQTMKLPADVVRRRIKIYRASRAKWRGKIWIGGGMTPLAKFGARQTTRKHIVEATAAQSLWLFYNVFRPKYGLKARFSWRYKLKKRMPIVTYDAGTGRNKLEPAFIVQYKSGHKAVRMSRGNTLTGGGDTPLAVSRTGEIMVINEKLIEQARSTVLSLQAYAGRLLVKNIDDQVALALSKAG